MDTYSLGRCLLPERLREANKKQRDIVRDLGYDKALVSKWCHSKKVMDSESLINVSKYLDCHPYTMYELLIDRKPSDAQSKLGK